MLSNERNCTEKETIILVSYFLFVFSYLLCPFLFTTAYLHEQQGAFIEDYQTATEFVPFFIMLNF